MSKQADLALAQEFLRNPGGPHSQALQRLLREFRGALAKGKYVLVEVVPDREWHLARLSGEPSGGVHLMPDIRFSNLDDAERHVFKRRWNESGRVPRLDLENGSDAAPWIHQ